MPSLHIPGRGYYEVLDILLRCLKLDDIKADTGTWTYLISTKTDGFLKGIGGQVKGIWTHLCKRKMGTVAAEQTGTTTEKPSLATQKSAKRGSLPPINPSLGTFNTMEEGIPNKVPAEIRAANVYAEYDKGLRKERTKILGHFKEIDLIHKVFVAAAVAVSPWLGISNIIEYVDDAYSEPPSIYHESAREGALFIPGAIMFVTAAFSLATALMAIGTGAFLHGAHAMLLSRRFKKLRTAAVKEDPRITHYIGEDYLLMQKLFIRSSQSWGLPLAIWIFISGK